MSVKKYFVAAGLAFSSVTSFAQVCYESISGADYIPGQCTLPSFVGQGKRTDNNLYMGVVWSFDGNNSKRPDLVFGYRSTDVNASDRVSGADLNLRFNFSQTPSLEGVRLSYVGGKRVVLGNLGLGYSFKRNSPLLTGAIQAAHARGGSDFVLNTNKFVPYIEVNSLKQIRRVQSESACSGTLKTITGFNPEDVRQGVWLAEPAFPGAAVGGLTCFEEIQESDIRLKHDIHELAVLENGLKIYSFKYKSRDGDFVGVMAQDLLSNPNWSKAVVQREDGHYLVNYGDLGIRMTTLEDWNKYGTNSVSRSHVKLKS